MLEAAEVEYWVDGGWGVDALLGQQTRPHSDLDLAVRRDHAERAEKTLRPLGFSHDRTVEPGLPARLVLRTSSGLQVDLHPLVVDAAGNGWQEIFDGAWGLYPADGLGGKGSIHGHPVACLSPELQLMHHLCYEWKDKDRQDMTQLSQRLGVTLPPGSEA